MSLDNPPLARTPSEAIPVPNRVGGPGTAAIGGGGTGLRPYRGRVAPSPTGHLHIGHARTFLIAADRARRAGGTLLLRSDDLDAARFHLEFAESMLEDLRWLGITWDGPVVTQSSRMPLYRQALARLHRDGRLYACRRTRREVADAIAAPHEEEPVFPAALRPDPAEPLPPLDTPGVNWRFRVPDGETITFEDGRLGPRSAVAGADFGDFVVWRRDDLPSYQLSCAFDDGDLGITEVVRGEDLVTSTFRQILILRALGHAVPAYYHAPLIVDGEGKRLAKRHDALSLRTLRERGLDPSRLLAIPDDFHP